MMKVFSYFDRALLIDDDRRNQGRFRSVLSCLIGIISCPHLDYCDSAAAASLALLQHLPVPNGSRARARTLRRTGEARAVTPAPSAARTHHHGTPRGRSPYPASPRSRRGADERSSAACPPARRFSFPRRGRALRRDRPRADPGVRNAPLLTTSRRVAGSSQSSQAAQEIERRGASPALAAFDDAGARPGGTTPVPPRLRFPRPPPSRSVSGFHSPHPTASRLSHLAPSGSHLDPRSGQRRQDDDLA